MSQVKLPSRCQGLSMVELMVALVLGLLLTAAVLQTFVSLKRTYEFQQAFSRIQENGRYVIDYLSRDIRNAGFWGCNGQGLGNIQNHLNGGGDEDFTFDQDIDGTNGTPDGSNSAYDAPDTLIIRSAVDSGIYITQVPATVSSDLKVSDNSGLEQGDIVLASNCTNGEIFQITNDPGSGGNSGFDNVGHNSGNAGGAINPGNLSPSDADYKPFQEKYGTDAIIFRANSITYSVGTGASGEPALFKGDSELVEGVENFQVLYGEDTDDDQVPNYYVPADVVTDMENVVSVQISLLLRSLRDNLATSSQSLEYNGDTYSASDKRVRKVFTTKIALRNRLD